MGSRSCGAGGGAGAAPPSASDSAGPATDQALLCSTPRAPHQLARCRLLCRPSRVAARGFGGLSAESVGVWRAACERIAGSECPDGPPPDGKMRALRRRRQRNERGPPLVRGLVGEAVSAQPQHTSPQRVRWQCNPCCGQQRRQCIARVTRSCAQLPLATTLRRMQVASGHSCQSQSQFQWVTVVAVCGWRRRATAGWRAAAQSRQAPAPAARPPRPPPRPARTAVSCAPAVEGGGGSRGRVGGGQAE